MLRRQHGDPNPVVRGWRWFRRWVREHPGSVSVVLGLIVAAGGLALIASGLEREVAVLAVLGVGVTASALLIVRQGLMVGVGSRPSRHVITGWALTTVGLIIALGFHVHWAFTVVPLVSGLVLFTVGTRPLQQSFTAGSPTGEEAEVWQLASMGSILLGVAFLLAGTEHTSLIGTVLGIYFIVFGLIPLSAGSLLISGREIPPAWLIVAGIVILVSGFLFLPQSRPDWLIWVVGGSILVLGASFVLRRVGGMILVLLVGLTLILVLADRSDDSLPSPQPRSRPAHPGGRRLVHLR